MKSQTLFSLLLLVPGWMLSSQSQAPRDPAAVEVITMLDKHDQALNQHDLEAVMRLYVSSPKTVVIGTGPGERYEGLQEIRNAYTEFFKDFDKGTLKRDCLWKDGASIGNAAWVAGDCKMSDSFAGKRREYEMNVSATLERQNGQWKFAMLHFSHLTGSAEPETSKRGGN